MEKYKQLIIALIACNEALKEGLNAHDGQLCDCREEIYDATMEKACELTLQAFPDAKGEHMHRGISLMLAGVYTPARAVLIILKDSSGYDDYKKIIDEVNNSPISALLGMLKRLFDKE